MEMENEIPGSSFSPNINIWSTVKNDIELKIIKGEYAAGERVPTIREMAEIYTIGNTTAQKVLESLCEDGTVFKKRGVGFFVKPFVKEKLYGLHKKSVEMRLREVIEYAYILSISKSELINMIETL